jgi:hypothetical protein
VAGLVVRGILIGLGLLIMIGGLLAISVPGIGAGGLLWVLMGGVLVAAVVLERQRYRSAAAELTNALPGPGGGETSDSPIDPRFRPTAEAFVDPTTGRRMRVLADPATGERRYVAEA